MAVLWLAAAGFSCDSPTEPPRAKAPEAPTNVIVAPDDASAIVTFAAPASDGGKPITNYEFSIDGGATWTPRSPASTASPLTISPLVNGTNYLIQLRAVNDVGPGVRSSGVSVVPRTTPGAPSIDRVVPGNAQLTVSFGEPDDDGGAIILTYEYSTDNGATWAARSPASPSSPLVIPSLVNGKTYKVRLRATNVAGSGAMSETTEATPVTTPAAPSVTMVAAGNGELAVEFSPPTDSGGAAIVNYEYSMDGGATWVARAPASTRSPLVIGGLSNGTSYSVCLRAVNSVGAGQPTEALEGTPVTVAGPPAISSIIARSGSLIVAFVAPVDTGGAPITNIAYSTNNGVTWVVREPASTSSPLTISDLTNGTNYTVRVRALNKAGSGTPSPARNGTPVPAVPSAPVISTIAAGSQAITLTFVAPLDDGGAPVVNYDYSFDGGTTWTTRDPASVSSPWTIAGLTNGQHYGVIIRARNSAGPGEASVPMEATPVGAPDPPVIAAIARGNAQLVVTFDLPANDGGTPLTNIEYSTDDGVKWNARTPANVSSPLTIEGLANATAYKVRLRAVNAVGPGAASQAVEGIPATTPDAPTITSLTRGDGTIAVNFIVPALSGGAALVTFEYSLDHGATWIQRAVPGILSPLTITGLTNGTPYTVSIRAVNEVGSGASSREMTITPAGLPGAPAITGITAGNGQLTVAFTSATDGGSAITLYQYSIDDGATWADVGLTSPIVIAGLTNGQEYQVRLRAVNDVGPGAVSEAVQGTPVADIAPTVPDAPTISAVNATDQQILLTITPPANDGGAPITNYEYSVDDGATWAAVNPPSTDNSIIISPLTNGVTYTVRVRAVNAVGAGAASGSQTARPAGVPGAPTITAVTRGDGQLEVSFASPASDGGSPITNVEYSTDGGSTWAARAPASLASPFVISGLTNGTAYAVQLRAVNGAGAGAATPSVAGTPATVPAGPAIAGITAGNGQLTVAFTSATDGGSAITLYQYSIDDGATWTDAGLTSPIVIAGLTNGQEYQVRLRAVNDVGPGAVSDAVQGTPVADVAPTVPDAPTISTINSIDQQILLTITPPANDGGAPITNYEYSVDDGATWTALNPPSTDNSIIISPLTNGVTYTVRVRAVNAVGAGAASDSQTARRAGVPGAPTITAVTRGDGQLEVSFALPASDGGSPITNVEYSTDGVTWAPRNPLGVTSPLTITGLVNGTTYTVYLRAVNDVGPGTASPGAGDTPASIPGAPTLGGVTPGDGSLTVAVTAGSDGGDAITNYEFSVDDGATWTRRDPVSTSSPIVITGLINGTLYHVRLRAVNAIGFSDASNAVTGTPVASESPPTAPVLISVAPGSSQLTVAFDAPLADGGSAVTNYEYSIDGGATWVARNPAATESPLLIAGLEDGRTYSIRIRAVNAVGPGAESAEMNGTPASAASAPTIQSVTPGDGELRVAFSAPIGDGGSAILNYEYSVDDGANWSSRNPVDTSSPLLITGLTNGVTYQVRLRAVNAVGAGDASNLIHGIPVGPHLVIIQQPSGAVEGLPMAVQPVIEIRDADNNRVTTGSPSVTASIVGSSGSLSGTVTVIAQNGLVTFANLAISGAANVTLSFGASGMTSVNSNSVPVTPTAPTTLGAEQTSNTEVTLTWQDNSGIETAYRVERSTGTGEYQQIAVLSANSTSFVDDAVSVDVLYGYRVRACTDDCSASSNAAVIYFFRTLANDESLTISSAEGLTRYYRISLTSSQSNLWASITGGTGDADLQILFGDGASCTAALVGDDVCNAIRPSAGVYILAIYAFTTYDDVRLRVGWASDNSSFNGETSYLGNVWTVATFNAVENAMAKWKSAITSDVQGVAVNETFSWDGQTKTVNKYVDDFYLIVSVAPFDLGGGTVAQGQVLKQRSEVPGASGAALPVVAWVRFDPEYFATLSSFDLERVAMHEIGHGLGIGTVWDVWPLDLIRGTSGDPYLVGTASRNQFDIVGGSAYSGNKVPVEEFIMGHWRESVFRNELMSPSFSIGESQPLSRVSIGALDDLGWRVTYTAAEPYTYSPASRLKSAQPAQVLDLSNDIVRSPVKASANRSPSKPPLVLHPPGK